MESKNIDNTRANLNNLEENKYYVSKFAYKTFLFIFYKIGFSHSYDTAVYFYLTVNKNITFVCDIYYLLGKANVTAICVIVRNIDCLLGVCSDNVDTDDSSTIS